MIHFAKMTSLGFISLSSFYIVSYATALPEPVPVQIEEEDLCPDCHCGHCLEEEQKCLCDEEEVKLLMISPLIGSLE